MKRLRRHITWMSWPRIPIEPQLAAECDAGQIETIADTHMQGAVQKLLAADNPEDVEA